MLRPLARRLLPLQVGIGLQGVMLWVPVEKLFQTGIGFDAASIGLMAAAYAAVVPVFEVPSGVLVATIGLGGVLAARLRLDHRPTRLGLAGLLTLLPLGLTGDRPLLVVIAAQTGLAVLLAVVGIHAGRLLHDAVASSVRAGVSSGAGTLSWLLFLPFSIGFGRVTQGSGVAVSAWLVAGVVRVLAALLAAHARRPGVEVPRELVTSSAG